MNIQKLSFPLVLLIAFGVYILSEANAHSTGMIGLSTRGCSGVGDLRCHEPDSATRVSIVTNDTHFKPSTTYTFSVLIENPGKLGAGVNIAADSGVLSSADQNLALMESELSQSSPKALVNGKTSFAFTYTTPSSPGTYKITAAANAVDLDAGPGGDGWNIAPPFIIESGSQGVAAHEANSQLTLYPNPASTKVTLMATNEIGKDVWLVNSAGKVFWPESVRVSNDRLTLKLDGLSSGKYSLFTLGKNGALYSSSLTVFR